MKIHFVVTEVGTSKCRQTLTYLQVQSMSDTKSLMPFYIRKGENVTLVCLLFGSTLEVYGEEMDLTDDDERPSFLFVMWKVCHVCTAAASYVVVQTPFFSLLFEIKRDVVEYLF